MIGYIWLAAVVVLIVIVTYIHLGRKAGSFKYTDILGYDSTDPLNELGIMFLFGVGLCVIGGLLFLATHCVAAFTDFLNTL